MTRRLFRFCLLLTLGFAASQTVLSAQEKGMIDGVWSLSVTVVDCQTNAPIRTVASLQQFRPDGSLTETANSASRGISEGVWGFASDSTVATVYWFYRYNPDGTFRSRASATNKITLGQPDHFTAVGMVKDYDANGNLLSTGCVTQTATRLVSRLRDNDGDD
jgi:hypothetical protein